MAGADEIARAELDALRARGLLRVLEPLRSPPGAEIELRPGERLINFSSNDYLGLASDARIAEALSVGTRTWGAGAGASRLVCGDFLPQHELEEELARFASSEAALLFGSVGLTLMFSSLMVSTATIIVGGIPAAIYERYVGAKGFKPALSKIGTAGWQKQKDRVKAEAPIWKAS